MDRQLAGQKLNNHMKHIQSQEEYIRESSHEGNTNEIDASTYISLLGKTQLNHHNRYTDEDLERLTTLYKFLGGAMPLSTQVKPNMFRELTLAVGKTEYPRLYPGKQEDGTWLLRDQKDNPAITLEEKYYLFPTIEEMIHFIAAKYGPEIEWDKIK